MHSGVGFTLLLRFACVARRKSGTWSSDERNVPFIFFFFVYFVSLQGVTKFLFQSVKTKAVNANISPDSSVIALSTENTWKEDVQSLADSAVRADMWSKLAELKLYRFFYLSWPTKGMANLQMEPWNNLWANLSQRHGITSQVEPWNNLWAHRSKSKGMANSQIEPWNNLWADLSQGMANSQMEPWNNLWADLSQGMANPEYPVNFRFFSELYFCSQHALHFSYRFWNISDRYFCYYYHSCCTW